MRARRRKDERRERRSEGKVEKKWKGGGAEEGAEGEADWG